MTRPTTRMGIKRRRRAIRRVSVAAAVLSVAAFGMVVAPDPHVPPGVASPTPATRTADGVRPFDRTIVKTTPEVTDAADPTPTRSDTTPAPTPASADDRGTADVTRGPVVPSPRGGSGTPTAVPASGQPSDRPGVDPGTSPAGPPVGGEPDPGDPVPPPATGDDVVDLTNAHRVDAGCDPLVIDAELDAIADSWSAEQAATDTMSHSPGAGVTYGENVARGQQTPAEVVQAWMASPGHRANILNCEYRTTGSGYAPDDTGPYWTQTFGF